MLEFRVRLRVGGAAIGLDDALGDASLGAERARVLVEVVAPDRLRAVEAHVGQVARALVMDAVAPPVAGLVATLWVSCVAPA